MREGGSADFCTRERLAPRKGYRRALDFEEGKGRLGPSLPLERQWLCRTRGELEKKKKNGGRGKKRYYKKNLGNVGPISLV